jgi:hypothetical protein
MPRTIADYVVIEADQFKVANSAPPSQKAIRKFTLPPGARTQDPSVLSFFAWIKDPTNIHIDIYVNDEPVWEFGFTGDLRLFSTLHCVIKPDRLRAGENTIRFVSSGDPADFATFSDVVLMFQRTEGPVRKAITIKAGGLDRTAVRFQSTEKDGGPVVIAFHGHNGNGSDFAEKTNLHAEWPEATMYFPDGLHTATAGDPEGEKPGWQKREGEEGDRDIELFDAILEREGFKPGDKRKVFLAGFSNGASLTVLLWSVRRSSLTAVAVCAAGGQRKDLAPMPAVLI